MRDGLSAPFTAEGEDKEGHHKHADEGFDGARDHWIGYYRGCSFSSNSWSRAGSISPLYLDLWMNSFNFF